MKLGIIAPEFPPDAGGMQEHAARLVECLADDHEVCLFTGHTRSHRLVPAGVAVDAEMTWHEAVDIPRLARASVDAWIVLNAGISPYICRLPQPAFAYVHGNDLVHPWFPRAGLVRRATRRLLPASRRIQLLQQWRKQCIWEGLQAARLVFTNSRFTRSLCLSLTPLTPEKVAIVAPGIGSEFFQAVERPPEACLRIITTARLEASARRKNIDGVLEAVAQLKGEMDIAYTVIGDGNDRTRLQRRAVELGIAGQVRFAGRVDAVSLRSMLAASHLFAMAVEPSEQDVEGFGMVYAEAAASGLPSLATATGGIPDAVQDGITGILLNDSSSAAIADGIRRFQKDRASFDPQVIQSFARSVSAQTCTKHLVTLIQHALGLALVCPETA